MCYLVREQQAAAQPGGVAPAPGVDVRPRWVGAAVATLVGGVALAAALATPPATAPEMSKETIAPIAAKSSAVPPGGVVEQGPGMADDGVPGDAGLAKARSGNCSHGM